MKAEDEHDVNVKTQSTSPVSLKTKDVPHVKTKKENAPTQPELELSLFERRRLENIKANQVLLKDLSNTAAKITPKAQPASKPKASTPRASRSKADTINKSSPRPTRTSSRLRGVEADSEVAKRKREEEEELAVLEDKIKRKRISGDLKLSDIAVAGNRWNQGDNYFTELKKGAQPDKRTFTDDDIKETTDADLKKLREQMSGLELCETWSPAGKLPIPFPYVHTRHANKQTDIKITPERIYSLGFHPTASKQLIFAGDKVGNLGIFDASQEAQYDEDGDIQLPYINVYKIHTKTVSSFQFSHDALSVYTSSYDSSIRKLDLAKQVTGEVWSHEDEESISGIQMPSQEENIIYFSLLDGSFGRVDIRSPKDAEVWQIQDKKIGGFSLHPLLPHLVATASLDRTLKIWDLRNIRGKGENRHPQLLGEHESPLSTSHAAWNSSGQIATSSYDDTIKIHGFPSAKTWKSGHDIRADEMEPAHVIRHNNQTGRWVTILKPKWQEKPEDGIQKLCIGNMNRFVDVYAGDGEQLAQLGGDGISAVPAVAEFHPTKNWVAGGTASGKLCLWM